MNLKPNRFLCWNVDPFWVASLMLGMVVSARCADVAFEIWRRECSDLRCVFLAAKPPCKDLKSEFLPISFPIAAKRLQQSPTYPASYVAGIAQWSAFQYGLGSRDVMRHWCFWETYTTLKSCYISSSDVIITDNWLKNEVSLLTVFVGRHIF